MPTNRLLALVYTAVFAAVLAFAPAAALAARVPIRPSKRAIPRRVASQLTNVRPIARLSPLQRNAASRPQGGAGTGGSGAGGGHAAIAARGGTPRVVRTDSSTVPNPAYQPVTRIGESSLLRREAERSGRSHQAGLDDLTRKLTAGHLNPGKGNKPIGSGISESRHESGARVYWRLTPDRAGIEILGKSHKGNQQKVINEIQAVFGVE